MVFVDYVVVSLYLYMYVEACVGFVGMEARGACIILIPPKPKNEGCKRPTPLHIPLRVAAAAYIPSYISNVSIHLCCESHPTEPKTRNPCYINTCSIYA